MARMKVDQDTYESLDSNDLLRFGQAFAKLGWAIQEQVERVLSDVNAEANPNAIELAYEKLAGYSKEIDEGLEEWLRENGRDEVVERESE